MLFALCGFGEGSKLLPWFRSRQEGVYGFYKGLLPNVLKVMPTGAIVFASYEKIRSVLSALVLEE